MVLLALLLALLLLQAGCRLEGPAPVCKVDRDERHLLLREAVRAQEGVVHPCVTEDRLDDLRQVLAPVRSIDDHLVICPSGRTVTAHGE